MRFGSLQSGYEAAFVAKMSLLSRQGFDFERGARAALEAKFGGAADVLLRDMTEEERKEPGLFASELMKAFGRGAMGFLEPIRAYGDRGLFPRKGDREPFQMAMGSPGGSLPLHDHRIRDEQGNFAEDSD